MSDAKLEAMDWLRTPTSSVWLDQDLLTGDGLIEEIAPDSFTLWDDGLERVRFGKLVGISGGYHQNVPIVPELLPSVVEAAVGHPGACVFVEEIDDEKSPVDLWRDFFRSAIKDARDIIYHPDVSNPVRKPGFEYVASLVDPRPGARHRYLRQSRYDEVDVISFIGHGSQEDLDGRMQTAQDICEHIVEHKALTYPELDKINEVRLRALGYLTFSE